MWLFIYLFLNTENHWYLWRDARPICLGEKSWLGRNSWFVKIQVTTKIYCFVYLVYHWCTNLITISVPVACRSTLGNQRGLSKGSHNKCSERKLHASLKNWQQQRLTCWSDPASFWNCMVNKSKLVHYLPRFAAGIGFKMKRDAALVR